MQDSLLQQGVDLMLLGMGTVFVFLTLLVIATTLMSAVTRRYFLEPEPELAKKPAPATAAATVDARLLAVIKAAIDRHRSGK